MAQHRKRQKSLSTIQPHVSYHHVLPSAKINRPPDCFNLSRSWSCQQICICVFLNSLVQNMLNSFPILNMTSNIMHCIWRVTRAWQEIPTHPEHPIPSSLAQFTDWILDSARWVSRGSRSLFRSHLFSPSYVQVLPFVFSALFWPWNSILMIFVSCSHRLPFHVDFIIITIWTVPVSTFAVTT